MNHGGTIAAILLLVGSANWEAAAARPDVRKMTCEQARATVRHYGAVVMTTGQYTFERFVVGQPFCYFPFVARSAWVSTRDSKSCWIGFTCEQPMPLFDW